MLGSANLFQAIADQSLFKIKFLVNIMGVDFEEENFINLNYPLRLFDIAVQIKASPLECAAAWENTEIFEYFENKIRNKYFPTTWWGSLLSYFFIN